MLEARYLVSFSVTLLRLTFHFIYYFWLYKDQKKSVHFLGHIKKKKNSLNVLTATTGNIYGKRCKERQGEKILECFIMVTKKCLQHTNWYIIMEMCRNTIVHTSQQGTFWLRVCVHIFKKGQWVNYVGHVHKFTP